MSTRMACVLGMSMVTFACGSEAAGGGGTTGGSTGSTVGGPSSATGADDDGSGRPASDGGDTTGGPNGSNGSSSEGGTAPGDSGSTTGGGSDSGGVADCARGSKSGAAGSTDAMPTSVGVSINVRTPADYDATVAHPLVVVFAPAGADAGDTEAFTGLTTNALAEGYVIAYADHVSPMSVQIVADLAPILDDIVDTWCIDESRVFYTGHSDGGTISEVLLAVDDAAPRPVAAAPSAAGITGTTMSGIGCPATPTPIMVIHSSGDMLFPIADGFGLDAATVWAGCNGCGDPVTEGPCQRFMGCNDGVPVLYCQTAGIHGQWTGLNDEMFAFFAEVAG